MLSVTDEDSEYSTLAANQVDDKYDEADWELEVIAAKLSQDIESAEAEKSHRATEEIDRVSALSQVVYPIFEDLHEAFCILHEESSETQNMEDLVQTSTCVKKKQKYQKGWKFKFKKRSWRRMFFQEKFVDEFSIGFGFGDLFERAELFQHTIDIKVGSPPTA